MYCYFMSIQNGFTTINLNNETYSNISFFIKNQFDEGLELLLFYFASIYYLSGFIIFTICKLQQSRFSKNGQKQFDSCLMCAFCSKYFNYVCKFLKVCQCNFIVGSIDLEQAAVLVALLQGRVLQSGRKLFSQLCRI